MQPRVLALIGPEGPIFPTRSGKCAYNRIQIAITRTLRAMGFANVRVHDLRHSGQLLAATNAQRAISVAAALRLAKVTALVAN
jgi:integrase